MQNQNIDQSVTSGLNQRQHRKFCLGWPSLALLTSLALVSALIAYHLLAPLMPKMPNRPEGFTARVSLYIQQGHMKSDLRTMAAAFRYLMQSEERTATATDFANLPIAEKAGSSLPKS